MDENEVVPLSRSLLDAWLVKHEFRSQQSSDNRCLLSFSYSEDTDCELEYSIVVTEGEDAQLSVRGWSDKKFRSADRPSLLEVINEYHDGYRWPLIRIREQGRRINLDTSLDVDLSAGVSFALFDDLLTGFLDNTYSFWIFMSKKDV